MTKAARIGYGTLFQRSAGGSPEAFTTLAEVGNISGPTRTFDTVDVTTQESADATREFIAGLIDPGEFTLDVKFLPNNATHQSVQKDHNDRVLQRWRLKFPDSPEVTWTFEAFVTGFELDAPIDDVRTASITLKVTGATEIVPALS